jgi:hypothetical protein
MLESASNISFREKLSYPLLMRNSITYIGFIMPTYLALSPALYEFVQKVNTQKEKGNDLGYN